MVTRSEIEELKNIPIIEVARMLGIEVLIGNKAMCFVGHDKKTPSLSFNMKANYWKCFGCGQGGDTINLVQKVRNNTFSEAVYWLRSSFQVCHNDISKKVTLIKKRPPSDAVGISKETEYEPDKDVYEWIIENSGLSHSSLEYLHSRGFSDPTIEHFKIRDLLECSKFYSKLLKHWGPARLQSCGLVTKGAKTPPYWDHSLWFPFINQKRITYLQRRRFSNRGPKYVNLSYLAKPYFNIDIINSLRPTATVFICEGIPDTIMAHQLGWNAIGVLGATSVNEGLLELLFPYRIMAIPDMDAAGEIFYSKIKKLFAPYGKQVERIFLQGAKDFCDYACQKLKK
jgi:DNA primase